MSSCIWSNNIKGSPRKINKNSSFNKAEKTTKRRTKLIIAKQLRVAEKKDRRGKSAVLHVFWTEFLKNIWFIVTAF